MQEKRHVAQIFNDIELRSQQIYLRARELSPTQQPLRSIKYATTTAAVLDYAAERLEGKAPVVPNGISKLNDHRNVVRDADELFDAIQELKRDVKNTVITRTEQLIGSLRVDAVALMVLRRE